MKGQYFVLIILSLIELIVKDKGEVRRNERDLLFYLIIGLFCFYMIWEIKSRYIYCLYPIFIILSSNGIIKLKNILNERRLVSNGKV